MFSLTIVKKFDVVEHVLSCLVVVLVVFSVNPLGFEFSEEAFGGCVIVTVSASAHAADDSVAVKEILEFMSRVL